MLTGAAASSCAPKLAALPGGPGTPFADYAAAYADAIGRCRGVRTFAGVIDLSGRVADERLRARIDAGFAEPGRIRLEGQPPALAFGRPIFILAGDATDATLVLPRDRRYLTGVPAADIVEALTGVTLTADQLRSVVGGCGLGAGEPSAGRAYANGWIAVEVGDTTTWLQNVRGAWQPRAAVRGPLEVRYEEFGGAHPTRIRIRTAPKGSGQASDLTLRLSDVDINIDLAPGVFEVEIPKDATPMTLDELRRARPAGRAEGGRPKA
jgi:hypothetical protein